MDNFKLLLATGADPDPLESGEGGFSPLSMVSKHGLDEAVKALMGLGVDGTTAIKYAAASGNTRCVEMLLDAESDPNVADNDELATIHNAVDENHLDVVKLLVERGSNINLAIGECTRDHESQLRRQTPPDRT